jgi:hypothetical protein
MCGRRRLGKNFLTFVQHWSGVVMCPACLCGGEAAGHNALRGSGPMCGRRRLGKNFLTFMQHWSGAVMCPACLCGGEAAGA